MERIKVSHLLNNPNNPRVIKDDKFKKLVNSIKEFPEMLEARPVVVNPDMIVLGGNMRLKALKEAGVKEVPVYVASWDEIKQKQFIIKDNVGYGEWDWDMIANGWDANELGEWGLDVWQPEEEVDYSALDDLEGLDEDVSEMEGNVKSAIQIEFESEDYENAKQVINELRKRDVYIGGLVYMHLKQALEEL